MVILQLHDQPELIQAIFAGDLDTASLILIRANKDVNVQDGEKRTPLHAAAFKADAEMTRLLLEEGALVNAKDAKWVTPLHMACSVNAHKVVALLLDAEAEPGARDRLWQTPLHIAASNNAYECVELLADHIPNLDVTDRSGKTALHHAAHNGHTYIVDLLVSKGCAVNACDKKYFRPLHFAAQMGHFKTIDFLIKCGADVNASDCNQCTPLHMAAANGNDSVCRVLLNAGADKDAQNSYGNTPLHIACLNGQQLVCRDLINAGADPEAINFQGQTPLHISAASAHGSECMMYLLSQKVDVNKRSLDGRTPLHMTAIHGKFTRSTSLIDHGAIIDCTDKNGSTPLHITAQYGHDLLATTLMSFGANPSFRGYEGRTPLHVCCLSGNVECCRKFLMAGVDLNAVDDTGKTPIHYAAYKGSFECIDLLVSNGAKFCERDNIGRIPLHYAAAQGHYQCVFTLVGIGSPLSAEDNQGCTPLHLAAGYDLEGKCVEYFLEHQYGPLTADRKGFTPLHYAAAGNNTKAGLMLLARFKLLALENKSRTLKTPLHFAAKVGNLEILSALIEERADVNAQDEQGTTPLILAVREGQLECAIKLVRSSASVTICDKIHNMTAVHYCAKNGYHECLREMLRIGNGRESIVMTDSLQRTPLMLAVYFNHIECVKVLLENAIDVEKVVNMMDNDSHSSLFRAVVLGHSKIAQLLLANKAKANVVDVNGKAPIHLAAACGQVGCLQILVDNLKPEEAAVMDRQECTALHWACYRGNSWCVAFLLNKNVFKTLQGNKFSAVHCASYSGIVQCLQHLLDYYGKDIVNLQDSRKRSPLHICALHGHTEAAKLLLENGATLDILDEDERTPFTAAAQFGQNEIIELFLKYNVDKTHQDKFGNTALHWACLMKHTSTAVLLLKDMKDYNVIHSINKDNKTALHLAARNGLVYVTRELLKKGASVFAVDSEGYTPALCCAPNNQVAQCLALILLNAKSGGSGENDLRKSLKSFLHKTEQNLLNKKKSSVLKTSVHTQTDPALLSHSKNITESDRKSVCYIPPVWASKEKVLYPSKPLPVRPLFKSSWKKNNSVSREDECFLIDNSEQNENSLGSLEVEKNKGLNLHRSFSDMSISSHIDGKIDLEETLMARTLKELSERRRGCKECLLWQKRCTDCTLRYLLRQHLQGKRSPREFNEFLLKILNESSSEYRQKLVNALETWRKSSVYTYNKDSSLDFRRVVRQNKTKRLYGRNRRVLYKMENDNWCMVRKTPSVKITSMQPNNEKDKDRIGCKSAEAMLQNFERKEACETQNNENFSNQEGHNIDSNDTLEYEKFVAELLNEGKDHMAPVFHPEFLKKLQDMPLDHADTSETQFSETLRDYLQKLLNECERSEIYSSECILTDEDLLKYLENFIRNIRSSGDFDKLEQELLKINDENLPEETLNEDKHDMETNIDICGTEIVESDIDTTEKNELFEDYLLPPMKVESTDDLNGCVGVIPVKFIVDQKKDHTNTTRVYMIDKDSCMVCPERKRGNGIILNVPFITEENGLNNSSLNMLTKPKIKSKKDLTYSFQQHNKIKDASAADQKKVTLSSKSDGHIDKDCRDTSSEVKFTSHSEDTSNESSEFSDNEFY